MEDDDDVVDEDDAAGEKRDAAAVFDAAEEAAELAAHAGGVQVVGGVLVLGVDGGAHGGGRGTLVDATAAMLAGGLGRGVAVRLGPVQSIALRAFVLVAPLALSLAPLLLQALLLRARLLLGSAHPGLPLFAGATTAAHLRRLDTPGGGGDAVVLVIATPSATPASSHREGAERVEVRALAARGRRVRARFIRSGRARARHRLCISTHKSMIH